jgi:peroxiredoxin Q/BCP
MPYCEIPATSQLTFSPQAYVGKKLVLYFYPKDSTPGCTAEAGEFRDAIDAFTKTNALVVGVSRDTIKSHENFKAKFEFPFDLLADTEELACQLFGVIKMKKMYGKEVRGIERSTFIINTEGALIHEWRGVKVDGHIPEVLAFVCSL